MKGGNFKVSWFGYTKFYKNFRCFLINLYYGPFFIRHFSKSKQILFHNSNIISKQNTLLTSSFVLQNNFY